MNKTTLFLLAIGGALYFGASKLLKPSGASGPPALVDQGKSAFGKIGTQAANSVIDLANQALGSIPAQYGFKTPGIAPLGGKSKDGKSQGGFQVSIDVSKALNSFLGLFKREPGYEETHPKKLKGNNVGTSVAGTPFSEEPNDPTAFYGPEVPNSFLNGPFRDDESSIDPNFLGFVPSFEQQPLNTIEGSAEVNNPFLYDAPSGADFTDFAEPQAAAV